MHYKILLTLILTILFVTNSSAQRRYKEKDTIILVARKGESNIVDGSKNIDLKFFHFTKVKDSYYRYFYEFESKYRYKDKEALIARDKLNHMKTSCILSEVQLNDIPSFVYQFKLFYMFEEDLNKDSVYLYPISKFDGILKRERRRDFKR